ncbi:hypothetical protein [Pseudotabrizicola sp.]|uniref:hypothetical protein n=1 Tax=Pseudotabrizicola sp. TaxID=2939647 RepID=UPI002730A38C|nr:hypothetical protein [Pseudotabrizicola sp.]MDP2082008.1 hypothetical protein [Pseudotabrizicola sp.]
MMAQRKDMMRIIRQDAGFSAKLGFGGNAGASDQAGRVIPVQSTLVDAVTEPEPLSPAIAAAAMPGGDAGEVSIRLFGSKEECRDEKKAFNTQRASNAKVTGLATGSAARGQVVHVSLSLTTRQARLAEEWATAARCTVQFLIRRVAQSLRDQVFDDWERDGMPDVEEARGARGKHPTSVTLTLRPQFAADLTKIHDPLGIMGLARAMGPAYRARFQDAFDQALAKAKIQTTNEGDEQ